MKEIAIVFVLLMMAVWFSEALLALTIVLGIVAVAIVVWSWWKKKDTGRTLGLCPEKIGPAGAFLAFIAFVIFAFIVIVAIGYFVSSDNILDKKVWKKWYDLAFGKYVLSGIFQQFLMHSFFTNRLSSVFKENWKTAWVVGILFAIIHFPNWLLAIATFFWGMASAYLFLAYSRNVWLLGIAHGILATAFKYFIAIPAIGHGSMRVGPGFWQ